MGVSTLKGLDNFRDIKVASFSRREGLSTDEVDSVLASRNGAIWEGEQRVLIFFIRIPCPLSRRGGGYREIK